MRTPTPCHALAALNPVQLVGGEQTLFAVTPDGKVYATGTYPFTDRDEVWPQIPWLSRRGGGAQTPTHCHAPAALNPVQQFGSEQTFFAVTPESKVYARFVNVSWIML